MIPSLGTWPSIHALRNPDRPALIDGNTGRQTTFRELDVRTTQLAAGLRERGLEAGERVAIFAINSPEMLEVVLAVAKLGAVSVMINVRLTAPEVKYILTDSGASRLFSSTALLPVAEQAVNGTPVESILTLSMAEEREAGTVSDFDELLAAGAAAEPILSNGTEVDPDSPAVLMYTSGTTGRPKGAIITHSNLFWVSIYHNAFEKGLNHYDVSLASAPLFHIGALALYTIPGLYWGACSVILESFDPVKWIDLVEEHGVTKAFAVPTMWAAIASALGDRSISTLDVAITGGAPCPLPVIETLQSKGVRFTEGFGMTETTAMASTLPTADVTAKLGSIGIPSLHVDFKITDAAGDPVATGEVGELLVRGPSVSPGYWNNPGATAEAFRDGWFHSGDLAVVDSDGYYRIVDRMKDMFISGGENVYPVEVEQVLYGHPAVAEAAVIGIPDEKWGETAVAFIVLDTEQTLTAEEAATGIRAHAEQRLARFKLPKRFEFVDSLPRTATGKIRKVELRSNFSPTR
ncbi:acyl-CoA synthetase [Brevibacterium casei]